MNSRNHAIRLLYQLVFIISKLWHDLAAIITNQQSVQISMTACFALKKILTHFFMHICTLRIYQRFLWNFTDVSTADFSANSSVILYSFLWNFCLFLEVSLSFSVKFYRFTVIILLYNWHFTDWFDVFLHKSVKKENVFFYYS